MINENTNRGDAIVMILQAANVSGGMTLTKIREKTHLIITSQQLKEYLSSLKKNGLIAFQKGERFIEQHTRECTSYRRLITLLD